MNGPWSAEQREWLQALGHDVLELSTAPPGAAATPSVADADDVRFADAPALLGALRRAAGGADAGAVMALVSNIDALRISPAAKRALWPRLRSLRKRRRP